LKKAIVLTEMVGYNCFINFKYYYLKYNFEDNKGGNQKTSIKEEQTTQWPKEKDKVTNNDLQNIA
jgi:hypothetical protein